MLKVSLILLSCAVALAIPLNSEIIYNGKNLSEIDSTVKNSILCPICEYIIHEGEEFITKNTTKEEAIKFLDDVCGRLKKDKQGVCVSFVEANYDKIVNFIIEKASPELICQELHICENYDLNNEVSDCEYCNFQVNHINSLITNNTGLHGLKKYKENMCENIPKKYYHHCQAFSLLHFNEIVNNFIDDIDHEFICATMGICSHHDASTEHEDFPYIEMVDNLGPEHLETEHLETEHLETEHHDNERQENEHHDNEHQDEHQEEHHEGKHHGRGLFDSGIEIHDDQILEMENEVLGMKDEF